MPKLGDGLSGLDACMSYVKTLRHRCMHIRPNILSPNSGIYVGGLSGLNACMSYAKTLTHIQSIWGTPCNLGKSYDRLLAARPTCTGAAARAPARAGVPRIGPRGTLRGGAARGARGARGERLEKPAQGFCGPCVPCCHSSRSS